MLFLLRFYFCEFVVRGTKNSQWCTAGCRVDKGCADGLLKKQQQQQQQQQQNGGQVDCGIALLLETEWDHDSSNHIELITEW